MSDETPLDALDDELHHPGGCCNACASSVLRAAEPAPRNTGAPQAVVVDGRPHARLVVKNVARGTAVTVDLAAVAVAGVVSFGRAHDSAVFLDDSKVSRRHGSLVFDEGGVTVVDHGSGCGTYVGGKAVKAARLVLGERVYLGDSVLQLLPGTGDRAA